MSRYLKRSDGETYGPVDLPTLQLWATDGRVAPDDRISGDQVNWALASNLAELGMDWLVELRDGSIYGPIHLLALRDLIREGTVSIQAKIKHKRSGEEQVVCEALLNELLKMGPAVQESPADSAAQLAEAAKKIEQLEQELRSASGVEVKLRDEIKNLAARQKIIVPPAAASQAQLQDLRKEVEKWRKLYEEAQATAVAGAQQAADKRTPAAPDAEKWKKMLTRAAAEIEQLKKQQSLVQPTDGEMIPRARLEEAERRLAQTEGNYQKLLKTLNRSFGVRAGGRPPPLADNLKRRDVS